MKSICLLLILRLTAQTAPSDRPAIVRCQEAQRAGKWDAALSHAREWFLEGGETQENEHALQALLQAAARSQRMEAVIAELAAKRARLSVLELCLLAWLQHVSGDHVAAVTTMQEAAGRDAAIGWRQLSRLYCAGEQYAAAADAQLHIVENAGGDTPANLKRLVELMSWSSREDLSLHWLEEWKRRHPNSTEPWLLRALLHTWKGQDTDALSELEQALQHWPDHAELLARYATTLEQLHREEDARRVWMRLYDGVPGVSGKLHWLPWIMKRQSVWDDVRMDFERRRAVQTKDPGPLMALAEFHTRRNEHDLSLKSLREAVRLAPREPALLSRAAEAALAVKQPALAESYLARAVKLGQTGAAKQQWALVLLAMKRNREAGVILKELADVLDAEPLAELAVALTNAGFGVAAAPMLQRRMKRNPDDYRLAWLRVEILLQSKKTAGLSDECLRLAATSFPAMPVPLQTQPKGFTVSRDAPYLQPKEEPVSALTKDFHQRAFETMSRSGDYRWDDDGWNIGSEEIPPPPARPRMPALPADVRGLAMGLCLGLAREESPEAFYKAKAKLLAAGVAEAVLAERETPGVAIPPQWKRVRGAFEQYPAYRPMLLRLVIGEMQMAPDVHPLDSFTGGWNGGPVRDMLELRPAVMEAWKTFRADEPAYAVYAALKFASSLDPEELRVAEDALQMLEQQHGGPLLRGAVPHLGAAVVRDDLPADSLLHRLRKHLVEWADTAPPGSLRDQLQHDAILHTWKGRDPAAHLERAARMLASNSECAPERTHIPRWPPPPVLPAPPGKTKSIIELKAGMYEPRPGGLGSPAVPWDEALPGPGQNLLHLPPALPGLYQKAWDKQRPDRLVRAALLLTPGPWSADEDKLRVALDAVNNRVLKVVAALATKNAGFITVCMDALTAGAEADAEALSFAAAWAWQLRQTDKTAALLLRLAALQPATALRDADTALVGAAHLLLRAGDPVVGVMRSACAEALDRLVAFPLQSKIHESLGRLAERLDMADRAQAFQKAARNSSALPSVRTAPAYQQPSVDARSPLDRFVPIVLSFQ